MITLPVPGENEEMSCAYGKFLLTSVQRRVSIEKIDILQCQMVVGGVFVCLCTYCLSMMSS